MSYHARHIILNYFFFPFFLFFFAKASVSRKQEQHRSFGHPKYPDTIKDELEQENETQPGPSDLLKRGEDGTL